MMRVIPVMRKMLTSCRIKWGVLDPFKGTGIKVGTKVVIEGVMIGGEMVIGMVIGRTVIGMEIEKKGMKDGKIEIERGIASMSLPKMGIVHLLMNPQVLKQKNCLQKFLIGSKPQTTESKTWAKRWPLTPLPSSNWRPK